MKDKKKKTETASPDPKVRKPEEKEDITLVPGNEADVNEDDLEALGPKDLNMDGGDDEDLKHRVYPVDFSGKDLDVPGSELDDREEALGSEDEENNPYSIGGDAHDNLEETNTNV